MSITNQQTKDIMALANDVYYEIEQRLYTTNTLSKPIYVQMNPITKALIDESIVFTQADIDNHRQMLETKFKTLSDDYLDPLYYERLADVGFVVSRPEQSVIWNATLTQKVEDLDFQAKLDAYNAIPEEKRKETTLAFVREQLNRLNELFPNPDFTQNDIVNITDHKIYLLPKKQFNKLIRTQIYYENLFDKSLTHFLLKKVQWQLIVLRTFIYNYKKASLFREL